MDLDVLCSDGLASGDDPAKESLDVGSDVCVVSDLMPTAVSVWTVTPVDSSEEGVPVRELIQLSVLGEPLVDSLQEPMPAEERLEYAIQATAVIWEPLEQMRYAVSGDVDFDSFGMAPWDAGGRHGDSCQRRETFRTMVLQWLMRLLCRQAIMT